MEQMRAIILNGPGKPEQFVLSEVQIPEASAGEIRVRVQAAGLNPVDYKIAMNGHPNWQYPHVSGVDAAGIVDAVGEGVTQWVVGDRVVYHGDFTKPGGFAEYSVTLAHTAAAIPDGVTFVEAAAFPCAGLTAYQILVRKMHMQLGQSILVHAGAGGVGGYAIQLARLFGASMIIATASAGNADYVRSLGADHVLDYNREDVHARVMELTAGEGVDLILNSVNRATSQKDLSTISFGGQLACIAGAPETVADFQPSTKTFTLHKLMLGGAYGSGRKAEEELAAMAGEFLQLIQEKKIDPLVKKVIALEEIPQGLQLLSERHVQGKIVAKIGEMD
ncbi:NADPH:quinone reductase-like Zn-dependent oxidoreductase [Paenibacillus taihuensis]|uniref:NADPH:quinone reductase-like Zn-dependent oxidoreductase n=1 Tax=Paenibacillus taihuensis TaxID=1156355 RepID=A0A3D9SFT6_9BACL|nr:zinc-binding dehydrogenase [Paenibacillus taihuensis]REE89023.1 NADPH:quinone reductase-like Zn-dependent oxidoreductase [Paenibacillus taihuensis]